MTQPATGIRAKEVITRPEMRKIGVAAGLAILGSGQTSVVASSTAITSGCILMTTIQVASFGAIGSNQGGIVVRSINNGVGAVFGTLTNVAFPWDTTIHWVVAETK